MDHTPHDKSPELRVLFLALVLGGCSRGSVLQLDPGGGDSGAGTPLVAGPARYEDRNGNHVADEDDVLIVPFSTEVALNGPAQATDIFAWPDWFPCELDNLDSFGTEAPLSPGPAPNEITITLGSGARLNTRHAYSADCGEIDLDPASGIDLLGATSLIENPVDGSAAQPSARVDIVPGFVDSGQALGDDPTLSVALGDLDGDGDLDLVEGNLGTPNRAWFNDGTGTFPVLTAEELGTSSTRAVLLIDVDGDADLDLLAGNAEGEADELWRNDGTGTFQLRQLFGASDTVAFAAGDLDGDGDPDLVVADGSAPNTVWKSDEGFFFLPETIGDVCSDLGGCPTRDVALADVDRDGDLDLVEGNWHEPNLLQINEQGTLGGSIELGIGATSSVALGDLDLDGDPDLVVGDGSAADQVWINVHGNFVDSLQRLGNEATSDVALADFDQDGALDLVAAVRGGGNRFWLNDRSGTFVASRQSLGTASTSALAPGDVDGDGDLDFVAGNEDGPNQIWLQSLAGTWGDTTLIRSSPTSPASFEVVTVDIDQDGDDDLVAVASTAGVDGSVWRNDGSGVYALAQNLLIPDNNSSRSIAVGDIEGDGAADLILGRGAQDDVYLNNGTGLFPPATSMFSASHDSWDVKLVDLDGNGAPDYVYTGQTTGGIQVWTNQGGTFSDTQQTLGTGTTLALTVGDVDADGFPDLVEVHDSRLGRVWRNDGTARFLLGDLLTLTPAFDQVSGLALGDLDDDADLDLVSTDTGSARGNHVWSNDGTGDFTDSGQELTNSAIEFISVALGDLDGDGDLDIVGGGFDNLHAWFRNDGAGVFTAATTFGSARFQAKGVTLADVDRDGDVDIVAALATTTGSGSGLEVWFNR